MFKLHYFIYLAIFGLSSLFTHAQNWSSGLNAGAANTQFTTDIVDLEPGGSVVVGNYSAGTATFGTFSLPWQTYSTDPNNTNINSFIVKYASNNTVTWATRISSSYTANISSVTADDAGNIYVCGQYSTTCDFYNAAGVAPSATLYWGSSTSSNAFIAKYSSSGILQWAKTGVGTTGTESLHEVAVSADGTILVAAGRIVTSGTLTVGAGSVTTGSYLLWVDETAGTFERAYNYSNDNNYVNPAQFGLCVDGSNQIIVAGSFTGTTYSVKGSGSPITVSSSNNTGSSRAVVVAKYTSSGALSWAKASLGSVPGSVSQPSSLVCDASNNVYLGGSVNKLTSSYNLQFFNSGSTYLNVPISNGFNGSFFVVKLSGTTGYASWRCYGREAATGTRVVSLAVGPCNIIYAGINTKYNNPSFTEATAAPTTVTTALTGNAFMLYKLNSNGQLQSTTPHLVSHRYLLGLGYIACASSADVHYASSANTSLSLQTSGAPINLNPTTIDVVFASLNDPGQIPTLTLTTPPTGYCAYDIIPLSAIVTGAGPFTFTWSLYNAVNGTYQFIGTSGVPNYNLTPAQYNPYIFNFMGYQVIYVQVTVTNCSGQSVTAYQFIVFSGGVSFSQINSVSVCYTPGIPTPDALFSVNAVYANSYQWQYSSNGGSTWSPIPAIGYFENLNQLTVLNPTAAQNGYLFRCIMFGDCNTVVSNAAVLNVVPCPAFRSSDMESAEEGSLVRIAVFPNPASDYLNIDYSFEFEDQLSELLITDFSGRVVMQFDLLQQGSETYDISHLANGSYLCLLKQGENILKKEKIVIQH